MSINLGLLTPLGIAPAPAEFAIDAPRSAAVADVIGRAGGPFAQLNTGAPWPSKLNAVFLARRRPLVKSGPAAAGSAFARALS